VTKPTRLDAELVRRHLAASRTEAKRAIEAGAVVVNGQVATRASTMVTPAASVTLVKDTSPYASRGGVKLDGALARLDVRVSGRRWLDAGASTGGFTDRLLQGGAQSVIAVDVGYGLIDWRLRNDDRVVVLERTNARHLQPELLPWLCDAAVADLSFISLTLVIPALRAVVVEDGDLVLMVKPQFEVGRESVGPRGVVRDPRLWREAIGRVVEAGEELGLNLAGAAPSSLPGPAGNREFFVHLNARGGAPAALLDQIVAEVAQ
jgi:23S rRNA (cytidine1920-2'-O)/16S rRNA (cytidine1409-2'-O)-methyltransferase